MTVLVTGAAGFIGMHVAAALLARGEAVIGLDNLNDYYDPTLKQARVERLRAQAGFHFVHADIASAAAVSGLFRSDPSIDRCSASAIARQIEGYWDWRVSGSS